VRGLEDITRGVYKYISEVKNLRERRAWQSQSNE